MSGNEIRILLTVCISYIAWLMGGYDMSIQTLLIMVVADYVSGIMKAIIQKNLNSYIGWKGLIKKTGIFISIIVAVQIENIIKQPETIHNVLAFFFVVNEGISILENLTEIGVPVPAFLVKYLRGMRNETSKRGVKK